MLLNSRIAKKYYRNKQYHLLPNKLDLISTIKIIEKRYLIRINPKFLKPGEFNRYAFNQVYSNRIKSSYEKLRLFEAFVMTSTNTINNDILKKCRRVIENPKFYVFSFNEQSYIDSLLAEILRK